MTVPTEQGGEGQLEAVQSKYNKTTFITQNKLEQLSIMLNANEFFA